MDSNTIIDALGGTAEVARLCNVKSPSVSEWRRTGIPEARVLYLRLLRPDVFGPAPANDASEPASDQKAA